MDADAAGRRATLSLDGLWDFEFEGPTARLDGEGHTIRTPGIWQTQFPALRNAQGTGRYRRGVQIPSGLGGQEHVLILEGVFHESVILVDEAAGRRSRRRLDPDRGRSHPGAWRQDLVRARRRRAGPRRSQRRTLQPVARGQAGLVRRAGRNLEAGAARGAGPDSLRQALRPNVVRPQDGRRVGRAASYRAPPPRRLSRLTLSRAGERGRAPDLSFPIGTISTRRSPLPDAEPWSPEAPNLYDLVVELIVDDTTVDAIERVVGFRRFEARDGRLCAQWRAVQHVRRPRSGLASRGGMPPAERRVSRAALRQRQGDGPQHAALPRQDSRPALFRSRRPARSHRLARHAVHAVPGAARRARRCAGCSGRRSRRTGIIPRSRSGRCSTRAGASISTTIRTTGAG